ncbi:glycosyltransferase family 4 protein [Caldicellulosiruptor morganii]|uniref:Glycosyltransferase family 4 protein n=1 Tax=Caldicellulosiruptor morganii TaxID=1387555 RepID=A0ABY7BRD5_9FIRM|nr:glycosyltransferase family 4 protein [Caldicellulosiruptor morganii]WAM33646.1 glycosyltransferase family 4 protein [Caldicellulosiruptor morganii]
MRVLLVHSFYRQYGGEDRVFEQERKLLIQNGIEVFEYTYHNSEISFFDLPLLTKNMIFNRKTYNEVREVVKEKKINIVHCHNIFPYISPSVYIAAQESGAKVIQTLHNYRLICANATFFDYKKKKICTKCLDKGIGATFYTICSNNWIRNIAIALANMINYKKNVFDYVDKLIALTSFARDLFIKFGIPYSKIAVKPNFIFVDEINPVCTKENYIIFVGRLSYEKGIMLLLEAMKQIERKITLLVVGDGPLRQDVINFIEKNRLNNIKYLGAQKRDKVLELISKAKLLIFPSIWFEGFPMTILEAFSVGTPVLANNLGGVSEIVKEGVNGYLFDFSEQNLPDVILKVLDNLEKNGMEESEGNKVYIEDRYISTKNWDIIEKIYTEVLK